MKKSEVLKALIAGAAGFIPGGEAVKLGIEQLVHRNDDPDDDIDEIADAVALIVMGAIAGAEFVAGKDAVNDAVVAQLAAGIKSQIHLATLVVNKAA
jgi:hypothetical protein